MTTRIFIETLRHPEGRPRYSSRGQLYRTRLGGPDGEVLCEGTVSPVCSSCRALQGMDIKGPFEIWKEGVSYAFLRGDIEKAAKLDVKEGPVRFVRYEPPAARENVPQRRPNVAPARENKVAVGNIADDRPGAHTADVAALTTT